ncbi:MAG: Arm DNA-binding domain-containing protein, partial [Candidatus Lambdaproteobacteria bacterium]
MKNLAGGKKGLYLDIYHSGQRHYDFLKLYLEKGTSNRIVAANRETLELATQTNLTAAETGKVELSCIFSERKIERECDSLLPVTERIPNDGLFNSLNGDPERLTN